LKVCEGRIILTGLRVLLNIPYLIKKILVDVVLDVHIRYVKIESFLIQKFLRCIFYKKRFMEKYLCWFAQEKPYVPYKTMIERMVELTSSSSNVYEVVNDNSNYYRSMIMDAMRMNYQGDASECSIINEEPNADASRFFDLLKDFYELL
jgi:hypothetical protein